MKTKSFLIAMLMSIIFNLSAHGAGVTIITHGFTLEPWENTEFSWMSNMRLLMQFLSLDPWEMNNGTIKVFSTCDDINYCNPYLKAVIEEDWNTNFTDSTTGEVFIIIDWTNVGNHLVTPYNTGEVAEVAMDLIVDSQNSNKPIAELPIHLIGFSRGGSLVSELARLLGEHGIWVDHITTLDPHPVKSSVTDPDPLIYENILYADNYYQLFSYPGGSPLYGAYNRQIDGDVLNGYGYETIFWNSYDYGNHWDIHLWYHGTIDTTDNTNVSDGQAEITPEMRNIWWHPDENGGKAAGFYYSKLGGGDRLNDELLDSGGRIKDGYHTFFGGSGGRVLLDWNEAQWPNIIKLEVLRDGQLLKSGITTVSIGESLGIKYTGQDYDSQSTVTLHVDVDRNPYNNNTIAEGIYSQTHSASGQGWFSPTFNWNTAQDMSPHPDPRYIYAKITDGQRTRYMYAAPALIFSQQTYGTLNITTTPVSGPIYVDGELKDIGYWSGSIEAGSHTISFGDVECYGTPSSINVNVAEGQVISRTGTYASNTFNGNDLSKSGDNWEDRGSAGDRDDVMEAGESPRLEIRLRNGADPVQRVEAALSTSDSEIIITDPYAYFPDDFNANDSQWSTEFEMDLNFTLTEPNTRTSDFTMHLTYKKGSQCYSQDINFSKKFYWQGNHSGFAVTNGNNMPIDDSTSIYYRNNGNSIFESGEEIHIKPLIDNIGLGYATRIDVSIKCNSSELECDPGQVRYPNMDPGDDPKGPQSGYFWIRFIDKTFTGPSTLDVEIEWEEGSEPVLLPDAIKLEVDPAPYIVAEIENKSEWNFGVTAPGDNIVETLTVSNTGSGLLTVTDITTSNTDTSIPAEDKSFTLAPGIIKNIEVTIDTSEIASGTQIDRVVNVVSDGRLVDNDPPSNIVTISGFVSDSVPIFEIPGTIDVTADYPDISGDWICWNDYRNGNGDIFIYQLSTGTELQITSNQKDQVNCRMSDNLVIWQDYRNDSGEYLNSDIYGYDLSIPELGIFQVANSAQAEYPVGLDNNLVAFVSNFDNPIGVGVAQNLIVYEYIGNGQFSSVYESTFSYNGGYEPFQTFDNPFDFNEGMLVVKRMEKYWTGSYWDTRDSHVEVIDFAAGETSPRRISLTYIPRIISASAHHFAYQNPSTNYEELWMWHSNDTIEQIKGADSSKNELPRALGMSGDEGAEIIAYRYGSQSLYPGLYYIDRSDNDKEYLINMDARLNENDLRMDGNGIVWRDWNTKSIWYTFLKHPDISINWEDISFSNDSPVEGELIDVTVTVKNLTNYSMTDDITVSLYDGDPDSGGIQLGDDITISGGLVANNEKVVQFTGITVPENMDVTCQEVHYIYVRLSLSGFDDPVNNTMTKALSVNAGSCTYIQLSDGWNLFSLPINPALTQLTIVLSSISGMYASVWEYEGSNDCEWKVYPYNSNYNADICELSTIESGKGYWIYVMGTPTLAITGSTPSNSITLDVGWNLVGYNASIIQTITDVLSSIDNQYISVWSFENGSWKVYDPANPGFSDLTDMKSGYGYWINTNQATTWTLP